MLFEYVTLVGLMAAMDGFEDGIPQIMEAYQKLRADPPPGPVILSERMEDHLRTLKGKYESALPYGLQQMLTEEEKFKRTREEARRQQEEAYGGSRLQRFRKRMAIFAGQSRWAWISPYSLARAVRTALRTPPPPVSLIPAPPTDGYYRGKFHKVTSGDLLQEAAEHRYRHIEALARRYDELAVEPDLRRPYVYVALHLQPERATNPNGGIYDEQHVIVALIASVLPQGWHIYVKEHPTHFTHHYASERGRWPTFYERILEHPGVSLVSRHTPSFSLIDNARAVATVTGTSSWEALVRGVPTLVFGEAWYKGCEGAYTVRTQEDCRRALERIAAGERPNEELVRLFLRAAEDVSFVGTICSDIGPIADVEEATNTARLAAAIDECYRRSAKSGNSRVAATGT